MDNSIPHRPHSFHIPVMGTGFSIDTPLKVAQFGISSVVSLGDDVLIEQMRKFHCRRLGLDFAEIPDSDDNARANRITAYLDFLDKQIHKQVTELQASPFEPGSGITRYFELLPESALRESYREMLAEANPTARRGMQDALRRRAIPGDIDVNIMTKLDRDVYQNGVKLSPEYSLAMAGLRGYARSTLRSSVILSAGINRRLFGYLAKFEDFFPNDNGVLRKRIVLKVSDFRSAMIQGKYLARKGQWVSEYRIESGLNCGGHAFATEGHLMGPILEEFARRKAELIDRLHEMYNNALIALGRAAIPSPHPVRITVQGGIGTAEENRFLMNHYGVDGTGWGTPFLLVPEVTNVDAVHLKKLSAAGRSDVHLSDHSPIGVPFWSLRDSASEETRRQRLSAQKPGSPCPKGYLVSDTEFTDVPICHASRTYQKRKLKQIAACDVPLRQRHLREERTVAKSCICHDLAGGATMKHAIDKNARTAVCCGPNIVNFSKVASLEEMVSHIYGRLSLLTASERPHMFIRELSLYVDYFRGELQAVTEGMLDKTNRYFLEFKGNLNSAIEYYQGLSEQFGLEQRESFLRDLDTLFAEIEKLLPEATNTMPAAVIS